MKTNNLHKTFKNFFIFFLAHLFIPTAKPQRRGFCFISFMHTKPALVKYKSKYTKKVCTQVL